MATKALKFLAVFLVLLIIPPDSLSLTGLSKGITKSRRSFLEKKNFRNGRNEWIRKDKTDFAARKRQICDAAKRMACEMYNK